MKIKEINLSQFLSKFLWQHDFLPTKKKVAKISNLLPFVDNSLEISNLIVNINMIITVYDLMD
jgi:hypothetical protein